MRDDADLRLIRPGEQHEIGELDVEWFSVCHSVPDSTGIAINTPAGVVGSNRQARKRSPRNIAVGLGNWQNFLLPHTRNDL